MRDAQLRQAIDPPRVLGALRRVHAQTIRPCHWRGDAVSVLDESLPKLESREQAVNELTETWVEMRRAVIAIQWSETRNEPSLASDCRHLEQLTKRLRHNAERLRSKSGPKGEVAP